MATRPTPGSRDGRSSTRPPSTSGGRPTSSNPRPASSDAATRRPSRASLSPAPSSDKPVPSFLRPTVSSSLRSTSPSPISRPSSSKGSPSPTPLPAAGRATRPITPKRSTAHQPASLPQSSTPKRSLVQPMSAPRAIAPAMDKAKAKSGSTSRWSVASPRLLMQKASNALKTGKIRSKKNKDLAGPAASAVASINKEASSGGGSGDIKEETARALPVEVQPHHPSGTIIEAPLDVQAKEATSGEVVSTDHVKTDKEQVITEKSRGDAEKGKAGEEEEATSEDVVSSSTDHVKTEEKKQVIPEEPRGDAEKGKAVVEEVIPMESAEAVTVDTPVAEEKQVIQEEPRGDAEKEKGVVEEVTPDDFVEAVTVDTPVVQEKPQTGAVEEMSVKEAEKKTEDELPLAAAVVEEAAKEPAVPLNLQAEPASNTVEVEEEVVVETNAAERQQQESPKPQEVTENSEKNVMPEEITEKSEKDVTIGEELEAQPGNNVTIAEELKEQPAGTEKQQDEVADEKPKIIAASRASSLPATSLEEALEEMDAATKAQASVSRSEPVTPAKEATSKDKEVIDTLLSASAPTTPAKGAVQNGRVTSSPLMAKIPEQMRFSFKGSKVKTAMEKRPEEEQPKKKEVARSNDVLEEAKSKLLEKKKSKVSALVGAFETVMDSPRVSSTPAARSRPTPR